MCNRQKRLLFFVKVQVVFFGIKNKRYQGNFKIWKIINITGKRSFAANSATFAKRSANLGENSANASEVRREQFAKNI